MYVDFLFTHIYIRRNKHIPLENILKVCRVPYAIIFFTLHILNCKYLYILILNPPYLLNFVNPQKKVLHLFAAFIFMK